MMEARKAVEGLDQMEAGSEMCEKRAAWGFTWWERGWGGARGCV
jgi:hypothetical protein